MEQTSPDMALLNVFPSGNSPKIWICHLRLTNVDITPIAPWLAQRTVRMIPQAITSVEMIQS